MNEETASGLLSLPWYLRPIAGGSEEADTANTPDETSAEGGPQEGTPATEPQGSEAPETNWQERYAEAQAWGTRAAQEAAALRQVIDLAKDGDPEAREYLGWDTPDKDEETPSTEDDRIARIEQQLQEQREAAEQAKQEAELEEAAERFYNVEFERLDPDKNWTDEYRQLVAAVGDEFLDQDGLPMLDKAHEAIQAQFEREFKNRVKSKRASQAPKGASPTHTPNLDDKEERRQYFAERLSEINS